MVSLRRGHHETRLEIMPLIDVIFLLLTFFIYAMVLMVRLDIVPMEVENFESDESAEPVPALAISIDLSGNVLVGTEPVEGVPEAVRRAREAVEEDDRTMIYVQVAANEGTVDRVPVLTRLLDSLQVSGLNWAFVSRPD